MTQKKKNFPVLYRGQTIKLTEKKVNALIRLLNVQLLGSPEILSNRAAAMETTSVDINKNQTGGISATPNVPATPKRTERERILQNILKKEFIPIKILGMLVMSSVGVMIPYMTIHMKSLGITVEETAVIYGVFPLFSIMAPPFMGLAADKIGNFKILFCAMLALCGLNGLLFLAIPTARQTIPYPREINMAISCYSGINDLNSLHSLGLVPLEPIEDCEIIDNDVTNLTLTIQRCGYVCYTNQTLPESLPTTQDAEKIDFKNVEIIGEALFVPDDWKLDVSCSKHGDSGESCDLIRTRTESSDNITLYDLRLKRTGYVSDVFEFQDDRHQRVHCGAYDSLNPVEIRGLEVSDAQPKTADLYDAESDPRFQVCRSECLVKVPRASLCSNMEKIEVYDPQLTFWLYLVLRVSFKVAIGGAMVLLEGAVLAVLMRYDGDLGIQRLFGVIGLMIFSPISGFLIDYASQGHNIPDFRPAFYMYAAMVFLSALLGLFVDLDFKPPSERLMKDIRKVLKNVELDIFFVVNFLSGLYWGYIESYLFWFLEDMGATKSLMGVTLTVSALCGIPVLTFSSPIMKKLGHPNVQVIGFLFYVIRLFGYSYIYDPYMCLIFESLEAFTTALMTTSAVAYSAELSSATTLTSVQGIVSGTYYGIGRGAGSLLGGFLMKWFGTRSTFRILGVAAFLTAIFYFFFNLVYKRCRREKDEKQKIKEIIFSGKDNPVAVVEAPVEVREDKFAAEKSSPGDEVVHRRNIPPV